MLSNSPCAACKFQRRKCTQECIFAPYFPPEEPQKFVNVHKVFGGSNVAKILSDLNPSQREDAAKSLAFEADARLRDPIYGCVGLISAYQQRLKQIQTDLAAAKKELSVYMGPNAMLTTFPQHAYGQIVYHPHQQMMGNPSASTSVLPYTNLANPAVVYGAGTSQQLVIRDQQQQQMMIGNNNISSPASALPYTSLTPAMMGAGASSQQQMLMREQQQQMQQHGVDPQQYAAVAAAAAASEQHELMRSYEQQQQQQEYLDFKNGGHHYHQDGVGQMVGSGFIQIAADENGGGPSLALGVNYDMPYNNQMQQQQHENVHHELQAQLVLQSPVLQSQQHQQQPEQQVLQTQLQQQQTPHKTESDEGRSAADTSC